MPMYIELALRPAGCWWVYTVHWHAFGRTANEDERFEPLLVENDSTMKLHPVVTLLAVTFFGFLWGPTGMLLSVPMMTYFKAVLLAEYVPAGYRDPLLILIEGDRRAPRRLRAKKPGRKEPRDPADDDDDWHVRRHNSD
ncbi:tqsA [Symbiodinium natans]|uniref:TqsA protein n=1 Tax=Symbiodinium natans TaxID=878477 RepID=A0A812LVW5_9DINO|nr:tqsA [Symbiodinium natans]